MYEPIKPNFMFKDFGWETIAYLGSNGNAFFVRIFVEEKRLKLYKIRKGTCRCIYWEPFNNVTKAKHSAKEVLQSRGVKFRTYIPKTL